MIVDDHLSSRTVTAEALREGGFEIAGEGENGKIAVQLAKERSPHIVLVAVGLPELDGISAAQKIMEENPLPIVLLTSHCDSQTIERAKTAGVMAYLVKPVRKPGLFANIEIALYRFGELMTLRTENQNLKRS